MNNDIRDWYLALTDPSKQIFLDLVSHDLTIHGRGFRLDLQGEQQTRAFKGLNELQHQLSGHISGLGQGRDRYPDDLPWQTLAETAAVYGLGPHLRRSLQDARSKNLWDKLKKQDTTAAPAKPHSTIAPEPQTAAHQCGRAYRRDRAAARRNLSHQLRA